MSPTSLLTQTPQESFVEVRGLRHHVLTWEPTTKDAKGTVLLAHGFMDFAWSWFQVAQRLANAGYRVIAWDWRGHGETEWIGTGGYYHFPDYAFDLEKLFAALASKGLDVEGAHLVGHSMGGTVCGMFAGVRSERLGSLTLIEGLGPPSYPANRRPEKMKAWFDSVARVEARQEKQMTIASALQRMRVQHPDLDDTLGPFLAEKATKVVPGESSADAETPNRLWRFDPLHRSTAPVPFDAAGLMTFLGRIQVPTLVVAAEKGFRPGHEAARYGVIPNHRFVEIPAVGHMVHWFAAETLSAELQGFYATITD